MSETVVALESLSVAPKSGIPVIASEATQSRLKSWMLLWIATAAKAASRSWRFRRQYVCAA
ncbi:MAG: hypothetical protein ACLPPF_14655 [Rhodomicrobium sp.]